MKKQNLEQSFQNIAALLEKASKSGAFSLQEAAAGFHAMSTIQNELFGGDPQEDPNPEPAPEADKKPSKK